MLTYDHTSCCFSSWAVVFTFWVLVYIWHAYYIVCAKARRMAMQNRGTVVSHAIVRLCFSRLIGGSDYKLIYRHYATLYFVFCVDSSESELGILDLIQVRFVLHCDTPWLFDFAIFTWHSPHLLGICGNARQMLWECLWAWPYFPRGQGRKKKTSKPFSPLFLILHY